MSLRDWLLIGVAILAMGSLALFGWLCLGSSKPSSDSCLRLDTAYVFEDDTTSPRRAQSSSSRTM